MSNPKPLTPRQRINRAEWKFVAYLLGIILVVGALWRALGWLF